MAIELYTPDYECSALEINTKKCISIFNPSENREELK